MKVEEVLKGVKPCLKYLKASSSNYGKEDIYVGICFDQFASSIIVLSSSHSYFYSQIRNIQFAALAYGLHCFDDRKPSHNRAHWYSNAKQEEN